MAYRVCIDPGHGGYDPGACGDGLQEKDITLDIALILGNLLYDNGISTVYTRTGDYAPGHLENQLNAELAYRCKIANDYDADLFVAIHVNSGGGTGEEVLVQGVGGKAETAASKLLYYLQQVDGWYNRGVKVQNVEVLRDTNASAILTENGFIDSVSDSAKLKDPNFRQALAVAHAKGICDYFGIVYKEGVEVNTVKKVVVYFSSDDYSVALLVANANGGCAMFNRNRGAGVNADALAAEKIINIGGPKLGVAGEVYWSGNTAADTAQAVLTGLKGSY